MPCPEKSGARYRGCSGRSCAWKLGFTIVELLVVMAIVGLLTAMLLPALQAARSAARKMSCRNNMKQQALGVAAFQYHNKKLPSGGKGTYYPADSNVLPFTIFDDEYTTGSKLSVYAQILPYLEQASLYKQFDKRYTYRDTNAPLNQEVAKQRIAIFVCPSNPYLALAEKVDPYGHTDYFATVYTDIDPLTGKRNKALRTDGALCVPAAKISAISDGTGNTIMFVEDAGRIPPDTRYPGTQATGCRSSYFDIATNVDTTNATFGGNNPLNADPSPNIINGGNREGPPRCVTRWADQDATGSGVSGPPNSNGTVANPWTNFVNQNASPVGGPAGGTWDRNNAGPNDEPFSFHPGGCNCVFADGSVHFLPDDIQPLVMRALVSRADGEVWSAEDIQDN